MVLQGNYIGNAV